MISPEAKGTAAVVALAAGGFAAALFMNKSGYHDQDDYDTAPAPHAQAAVYQNPNQLPEQSFADRHEVVLGVLALGVLAGATTVVFRGDRD